MTQHVLEYLKAAIEKREVSPAAKDMKTRGNLFSGLQLALEYAKDKTHQITEEEIIAIFDTINPEVRADMKFPTRRRSVSFLNNPEVKQEISLIGLKELFDWCEKNKAGYGPRIEIISYFNKVHHFKTIPEMREFYDCYNNVALADHIYESLITKNSLHDSMRFIPIFDSLDPHIDRKVIQQEEKAQVEECDFSQHGVYNVVVLKFKEIVAAINKKPQLTLQDIAEFIKNMMLLHPFPDGNKRTFIAAILNLLLLKNNFGLCIHCNHFAFLSISEISTELNKNLVNIEALLPIGIPVQASSSLRTRMKDMMSGLIKNNNFFSKKTIILNDKNEKEKGHLQVPERN